ncbi:MAG: alpha-2-macroglobulin [Clostridiaceae bacterium]|nr:alpha-2-macroglobulin [Clostridiaceae bacterium]
MWKRITAIILIFVLCVSVMWFANPLAPITKVSADTYKSGFLIVPEKEDASGVLLDSGFIISSQSELTIDYIQENVSIRSGEMFTVEPAAEGKFILKPTEPLEQNRVYFIDVLTKTGDTVSFAFQTKRDFKLLGSLPANMSSNVPVDTGIELYFSYPDVENISDYFEISPKVDGRFENNGYTIVFIPKELKPGTIYTVTVKKGLTAADKTVSLAEDYTFSFETAPDEKVTADPYKGTLYISGSWFEFSTTETPAVGFDLYLRERIDSADVILDLYRFNTLDDFIKAIRKKEETPYWAYYALSKSKIDTSGLEHVLQFKQSFNLQRWQQKYMMFPRPLEHGYYLVELSTEDLSAQAFLQISDIAAYSISDKGYTLFWLNDLVTKTPVKGAEIFDFELGKGFLSDSSGLVKIPNFKDNKEHKGATLKLYRITTIDGKVSILNAGYPYYDTYVDSTSLNWRYIQTDRTLYKPSDTVEFWGFVRSRIDNTYPEEITVELASGSYYYPMRSGIMSWFFPFLSNPLERLKLKTDGGFFEGSLKLPQLDPGSYTITVKDGDKILSSSYFRVENYIKPHYKLEITSDKKALFVGEDITFTIKASFFDGTPVSNVPLNYYINHYNSYIDGNGVTDKNGILEIKYTPKYYENMQGETYADINVSAHFPETGDISEYYSFRVFANDIYVQSKGEIKNNKGSIELTVNKVVLDTLNDDDYTNDNFIGKAVAGQRLTLNLVHITWEKIETGEEYDTINKVVRKTYEYREKKTPAGSATLITDGNGTAHYDFSVKSGDEGYYLAEVTTRDGNNRTVKNNIWIYNSTGYRGYPSDYEYFMLKADKKSYKAGETINTQIINNKEEPLKDMPTLFVEARNGIQNYQVTGKTALSMAFPENYAPNFYLYGIAFNGKSYIITSTSITYDYTEKKIDLKIKTDKEAYRPGDNMTITIEAADINGKPVPAKVNISLVDEALLKLSDQYIDPLVQLYSWIGDGIIRSTSNRDDWSNPVYGARAGSAGMAVAEEQKAVADAPVPAPSAAPADALNEGSGVSVRSEFKDTALFKTITLGPDGIGSYTFKLPDNITSFSLAAAAVSSDLYAGSEIQSARVTMPFFINDALSLDYLVGDKPYVGLTAYGDGLGENENVTFELTIKELPNYKQTARARAFERVNLPLPALKEGTYTIVMTARSESGIADALSRTITVHNSYRTIEAVKQNKATVGMKLAGGKSGITTLIFTDSGRGSLINALHSLAWEYGKRLDQKLVSNYARSLLKELIKNDAYYIEPVEVNPAEYRNNDGGYGILPYAGSDMNFTALITPLLKETTDTESLKMYFYNAVMTEKAVQAAALFALAELGEPVLLDLNRAAQVENLSLDEYIYLGMAYEALGDLAKANEIYMKRIAPELERKDPYIRVKIKRNDTDTSYRQTAMVAAYAARIGSPDASRLFAYVQNNYSRTQYVGVEKVLYLAEMVNTLPDTKASFSYTMGGKTYDVELSDGYCEIVRIPSININTMEITKVTGDVSVLSLYTDSFAENVKNDSGITITRKYYDAATGEEKTTFAAGDLVKVEITYTIDKTAIDNTYEISDYAPAGLKPLANPWNYGVRDTLGCWYRQFDGQKVTFVVGKYDEKNPPLPLVYYARVSSPGEYKAEGTIAQGSMVKSSIVTIKDTKIVIKP